MRHRPIILPALAAIAVLGLAAPAGAATLATNGSHAIVYTAAAGEANQLAITHAFGDQLTIVVTDVVPITIDATATADGCVATPPASVTCTSPLLSPYNATVSLGDGADSALISAPADVEDGTQPFMTVSGDAGPDRLELVEVRGSLRGGTEDDILIGGDAGPSLVGQDGADTITGGAGDDAPIDDGPGDDTVHGGGGDDTLIPGTGADLIDGGRGDDRVAYLRLAAVTVRVDDGLANDGESGEGDDVRAIERVVTGAAADVISVPSSGRIGIEAGGGADTITTGVGDADVDAGPGDDTVTTGSGADRVHGGEGADTITTGAGRDSIDGGPGADELVAGPGQDALDGGQGADRMAGGGGRDQVFYEDRDADVTVRLDGLANDGEAGEGDDVRPDVEGAWLGDGDDWFVGTDAPGSVFGGGGADRLEGRGGADYLAGGDGDDVLAAGAGDDVTDGGTGRDMLDTGPGDDFLDGGAGPDDLRGGGGLDTASWSEGGGVTVRLDGIANDGDPGEGDNARADLEHLIGSLGNDTLVGGARTGILDGLDGDDVLVGGADDDLLDGGGGDDTLRGGAGDDELVGRGGADTLRGGPGGDLVRYDTATGLGQELAAVRAAAVGGVTVSLDGRRDDGRAGERDLVGADVEDVIGTRWADVLVGNARGNDLDGGGGPDVLDGRGGPDGLHGGAGADRVTGGAGSDLLEGGPGDDLLFARDRSADEVSGGAGRDRARGDVRDRVRADVEAR